MQSAPSQVLQEMVEHRQTCAPTTKIAKRTAGLLPYGRGSESPGFTIPFPSSIIPATAD